MVTCIARPPAPPGSGDFYDLFEIDNRKVGLLIGDVSGKGLKAATLTSVVKNTVRAHAFDRDPPATVMAKVNDCVLRVTDQTSWVSVFLAVYDRSTGTLTYCSAGHPPAVLLRREEDAHNEASFLLTRSPAVGAFSEVEFVEDTAHLGPEDILVLYTDGVIEARREGCCSATTGSSKPSPASTDGLPATYPGSSSRSSRNTPLVAWATTLHWSRCLRPARARPLTRQCWAGLRRRRWCRTPA